MWGLDGVERGVGEGGGLEGCGPGGKNGLRACDKLEFGSSAAIVGSGRLEAGHILFETKLSPQWELLHQSINSGDSIHGYVSLVEIVAGDAKIGVGQCPCRRNPGCRGLGGQGSFGNLRIELPSERNELGVGC